MNALDSYLALMPDAAHRTNERTVEAWPRPTEAEIAESCQRALDAAPKALPSVARDFGHCPLILDRVAAEHSAAMVRGERRTMEARRDAS
jgi:hypothetical protein